jgi:DNA-directed RNA polymerase specialized sigma24 family protein
MTGAGLPLDLERLRPRLHRDCTRMVGSVPDAEDIVQDALVRALEAPDRPIDNPEGWLFRIAHNLALDLLLRRACRRSCACRRRREARSSCSTSWIIPPTRSGTSSAPRCPR